MIPFGQVPGISSLLLDSTHNIATPEGVELRLPVAGLAARSLAWLIDALIKFFAFIVAATALQFLGAAGSGLFLIGVFAMFWLYNVLFEVFSAGATPGKKAMGLRVMNSNGTPVGWSGSVIRNLLRAVDVLPGCYLLGFLSVFFSARFQRLGDLAAGTIVVHRLPERVTAARDGSEPLPLNVPLAIDEQQALLSFAERAGGINDDRVAELAELLDPIIPGVDAEQLKRHAHWLAGVGR